MRSAGRSRAAASQRIADALASYLRSLGGEIVTDHPVRGLDGLPPHRALLLDLTPRQVLAVAGDRLGGLYAAQLRRYRYGPGVFKVDLALDGPIPWTNPGPARGRNRAPGRDPVGDRGR